jgi:hypothetical protein
MGPRDLLVQPAYLLRRHESNRRALPRTPPEPRFKVCEAIPQRFQIRLVDRYPDKRIIRSAGGG